MSKRLLIFAAAGTVLLCVLAGAYWRAERAAEVEKQELVKARRAALAKTEAMLEKLERQLEEAERSGSPERLELQRKLEERRLKIEDLPPQYSPRPRPYLDPSRNPPER